MKVEELGAILATLYPWLLRRAYRYVNSVEDAEDLACDTILKVLTSNYDGNKDIKPFCAVIMQNTYITAYNRKKVVGFVSSEDVYITAQCKDQTSLKIDMERAITESKKRTCGVESVILYANGYSYAEISKKESIPVGTIRSRINYARKVLREALSA